MPRVSRESYAMRLVGIVEAGVFSFLRGEMSIECLGLETHLRNQLALKEALEVLRIGGLRFGKHALVDELVNCWALHRGRERSLLHKGDAGVVASEFMVLSEAA